MSELADAHTDDDQWLMAMSLSYLILASVIWMMGRRTFSTEEKTFEFTFRRESRVEVTVHVKVRKRIFLARLGGAFPGAATAGDLSRQVTKLTVRVRASSALTLGARGSFEARVASHETLLLVTRLGRGWRTSGKGRGVPVEGYVVVLRGVDAVEASGNPEPGLSLG